MSGSGVVGADVDGLHGTGRTIAGRSSGGGQSARGLSTCLDSSATSVGHGRVKAAITAFVTNGVLDNSNLLGNQLTAAVDNASNVAATVRSEDEEGARVIQSVVSTDTAIGDRINGSTAV